MGRDERRRRPPPTLHHQYSHAHDPYANASQPLHSQGTSQDAFGASDPLSAGSQAFHSQLGYGGNSQASAGGAGGGPASQVAQSEYGRQAYAPPPNQSHSNFSQDPYAFDDAALRSQMENLLLSQDPQH